jgi:hypothetical protein
MAGGAVTSPHPPRFARRPLAQAGEGRGEGPSRRTRAALLLAALAAPLLLAACGKKGPPTPPGPPDQITYPRVYPTY